MSNILPHPTFPKCIIFGGGGHARVIIDCLIASGITPSAILDSNQDLWRTSISGVPVLGGDGMLFKIAGDYSNFVIGVGQVGEATIRKRLFDLAISSGLSPLTVRHPSAMVSDNITLHKGAQILPGAIVNVGTKIGINAIINSGAIIEHDCIIGNHAHIASGARIGGGVSVGKGATIGIGATIRPSIIIGKNAIIGAGSVVVKNAEAGATIFGVPASSFRVKA